MKNYKKLVAIVFAFVFASFAFAEKITVMSFNIAHNSAYKKEHRKEWISQIAEIVKENEADVVLLQEVPLELKRGYVKKYYNGVELNFKVPESHTILDDIAKELGDLWKYFSTGTYLLHNGIVVDGVEFSGGDMSQNNAVLYNSSKFAAEDMAESLGFLNFPDCDYRFNKNNLQVIQFTEIETNKIFIVANVHLQSKNAIEKRDRDLENLSDMLLNEFGGELSEDPIVVGGDFNTNRWEFENVGFYFYYIDGKKSLKTTLSTSADKFKYSNDYDHFIYNKAMKNLIVSEMGHAKLGTAGSDLEKVKSFYIAGKEFTSAQDLRTRLSDHVPIVISFEF